MNFDFGFFKKLDFFFVALSIKYVARTTFREKRGISMKKNQFTTKCGCQNQRNNTTKKAII
jgi:hypothetical protein